MSVIDHHPPASTGPRAAADLRRRERLLRSAVWAAAVAAVTLLALLIISWAATPAAADGSTPPPVPSGGPAVDTAEPEPSGPEVSYAECVKAAFAAFGPPEEASSAGSSTGDPAGDAPDPFKTAGTGDGDATISDPDGTPEVHPHSPAHEMCTEDCPQDEQCRRPTEFTIVRDDNVDTISFENPEPEGDPAA
ncbi:hypothetical protein [Candidatus Poriferisodalis sp.]|uniref:hypothetical protein n=1 Tax=Candidatus Poriferisodalis sp. TaxID=3101277 RepID=UPI003B02059B